MSSKHRTHRMPPMEQTQTAAAADSVHNAERAMDTTQESLDRVRDILFGSQIREQDHRRKEFEEELQGQLAAFTEESRKRLDSLETFVKREIASVLEALKTESTQRVDALHGLAQQIKLTTVSIEKRVTALDEQHGNAARALRIELLDQSKSLRDELSALNQSLTTLMEKNAASLQHAKTDRAALAGLFAEMAQRLSA